MNSPAADTLTAAELASVVADVAGLVTDADTAVAVTYYQPGPRAFDPRSGVASYADTATALTAHLAPVDLDEVDGAKMGDTKLLIAAANLAAHPAVDDRFVAAGVRYSVYAVQTGALSTHYTAYGRRVT